MPVGILNLILDERKQLSGVDSDMLLALGQSFVAGQAVQRRVFKEFIRSSELYYIDVDSV